MTRIVAIVPARNEAPRIAETVTALISHVDEIVVVDDASTDDTADRARSAGARVLRRDARGGKGAALRTGCASVADADVLAFIDGDLGRSASLVAAILQPVLDGRADMAIAAPPPSGPSGFGLVERLARWGIDRMGGLATARPLSGQRALRPEIVERCGLAGRFGVEAALTIDALRAGFRVVEVPAPVEHRRTGRDLKGFLHRARQGWDLAIVLALRTFRDRPGRDGKKGLG